MPRKARAGIEPVDNIALVFMFIVFGASIPWRGWLDLGWGALGFAAWTLLLRRPPIAPIALLGATDGRTIGFLSWFGPMGIASVFYLAYVRGHPVPQAQVVYAAGSLAVVASVVVHGLTSTPGALLYGRRRPTAALRHPLNPTEER